MSSCNTKPSESSVNTRKSSLRSKSTSKMADSLDTTNKDIHVDCDQCDIKGMLLSVKTDIKELKSSITQIESQLLIK